MRLSQRLLGRIRLTSTRYWVSESQWEQVSMGMSTEQTKKRTESREKSLAIDRSVRGSLQ